jgi:hypothetical protein
VARPNLRRLERATLTDEQYRARRKLSLSAGSSPWPAAGRRRRHDALVERLGIAICFVTWRGC